MNNSTNTTSKEPVKLGDNDWGFSFLDESELSAVKEMERLVKEVEEESQEKLNRLYNMIMPLLRNLSKNPEKQYIYFPDRGTKVQKFIDDIEKLML